MIGRGISGILCSTKDCGGACTDAEGGLANGCSVEGFSGIEFNWCCGAANSCGLGGSIIAGNELGFDVKNFVEPASGIAHAGAVEGTVVESDTTAGPAEVVYMPALCKTFVLE